MHQKALDNALRDAKSQRNEHKNQNSVHTNTVAKRTPRKNIPAFCRMAGLTTMMWAMVRKMVIPAGITIFLTMAHIIVVNPAILQNAGMFFLGVLFATVLVCTLFWFLCSFL